MKVLIVEDEEHLAEGLRFNLEAESFQVEIAGDGEKALEMVAESAFEAIVLDVMLPEIDGFAVAKKLREQKNFTPILMLTALGKPEDVLQGFESGADDYLAKPFDLKIFLARLNGLIRRKAWFEIQKTGKTPEIIKINEREIDFTNLELRNGKEVVKLTLMEAKLLQHLIDKKGQTVSRREILQDVWALREDTDTRAIDNFIVRLRRYLENEPTNPKILQTVRGIGYRFVLD